MNDAPIGFLMALAQNDQALKRYGSLSQVQRRQIIRQARAVSGRGEMQSLVDRLGSHL